MPKTATPSGRSLTQHAIADQCDAIKQLLIEKNEAYGDSAINPLNVMSASEAVAAIAVRCDDKLSRIKNGGGLVHALASTVLEDTVQDLIGYLVLAKVAYEKEQVK